MLSKTKKSTLVFLIITLTLLTRFLGLSWGDGYFFHPDESNMARSISGMSSDLNPHFFAYGQFPLYLVYFTIKYLKINQSFPVSIYLLRFYSALFSTFSVLAFYKISAFFFKPKTSLLFAFLIIFTPGLIQLSKFGTTESLLILVFALIILLSLYYYQTKKGVYIILASLVSGIGIATKISSLSFITPIILSIIFTKNFKNIFFTFLIFFILTILFSLFFSPHSLKNWPEFISASTYETNVATGKMKVFYTRQFEDTSSYLFQITRILPYTLGIPVFLFTIFSLITRSTQQFKTKKIEFLIVFLPCLLYFLYFGSTYVKWTRFISPIIFIFPFLSTLYVAKSKKILRVFLLSISIIPGLIVLSIYSKTDVRVKASNWLNQNISADLTIFSEAGNVVDIPLNSSINTINFDFYNLDESTDLQTKLPAYLSQADYILIPSRRIFKNQANSNFPFSQKYYQLLFSGSLGFSPIKTFSILPDFLNHENAEETFTVFDHPTIRLYQKTNSLSLENYQTLLSP